MTGADEIFGLIAATEAPDGAECLGYVSSRAERPRIKGMLLTIEEVAGRIGLPRRRVRELVNEHRIAFVRTGKKKVMIPGDAIDRFIAEQTVEPTCRAETQDRVFASLQGENAITSSGRTAVAAASAARAQEISQRRKKPLASSSSPGPGERK